MTSVARVEDVQIFLKDPVYIYIYMYISPTNCNHKFISLHSTVSYMFWFSSAIFRKSSLPQRDLCMYQHISYVLYSFFWVIPLRLNFIWRRFGTFCSIFVGGVSSKILPTYTAYASVTNTVFRNVGIYNSDAGESPNRKNATFRTQRKFEIISYLLRKLMTIC